MKRLVIVCFSAMLFLSMFGCAQGNGDPVNNKVFTDEFFEDVTEIRFGISHGSATGEQLAAVARYLKNLRLTHTEEELRYEYEPGYYGGWDVVRMDFIKRDGTSLRIRLNQWAMSGLPGGSYYVSDYKEAIERGEKSLLRSIYEACGNDPDTYPLFS